MKLYLEHSRSDKKHYLSAVRQRLQAVLAPHAQTIYLQADVCRSDLLVEVEAVAMARAEAS